LKNIAGGKMKFKVSHLLSLALVFVFLAGSVTPAFAAEKRPVCTPNIVDIAAADDGEFDTLTAAVVYTGLVEKLQRGRLTVFAPTDAAFAAIGLTPENITTLDKAFVKNVLLYHITRGLQFSGDVVEADTLRMLNRQYTDITVSESGVQINQANIVTVDIRACNGVIHVIDSVLLPPAKSK
jgi:transforming growth factor-beta-induced protein